MDIKEALRMVEAENSYFGIEEDSNERFAAALMAFKGLHSLIAGQHSPSTTLDHIKSDHLTCLLRLIGREFQEVLNSRLEGGKWKTN
jgi:hypothetical protein